MADRSPAPPTRADLIALLDRMRVPLALLANERHGTPDALRLDALRREVSEMMDALESLPSETAEPGTPQVTDAFVQLGMMRDDFLSRQQLDSPQTTASHFSGQCPYCEAEQRGVSEGWAMGPDGWAQMRRVHDSEHHK